MVSSFPVRHFHDLCHTFITHMIDAGIDLYGIGKIVGHTNTTMTERYGHLVKGRNDPKVIPHSPSEPA